MSDASELERKLERLKKEIEREVYDRLPRKVGIVAVNHFKHNFREGGYGQDRDLSPVLCEYPKGSLLMVTGTMRRSISSKVEGHTYTVRQHQRSIAMPQRQFIGQRPVTCPP